MPPLPRIDCSLSDATARSDGRRLVVATRHMQRVWEWTGAGFATRSITSADTARHWERRTGTACDWQLPDGREAGRATLRELQAVVQDDDGFTRRHIHLQAELAYPDAGLLLRWSVWVYPGAPGMRTQLAARRLTAGAHEAPPHAFPAAAPRVDRIPLGSGPARRRLFGYYNDTQNRNDTHLDILKEVVVARPLEGREWCDWASAACLEDESGGIALVKESHKCVNQPGHETGGFVVDAVDGLACTGWGLLADELSGDAFAAGWATWCLTWSGGDLARELAFKTFDRLRFPIDPKRDVYIQANTWGSTEHGPEARRAAGRDNVLRELDLCAELGIDVLQIDDGWQVPPGHATWKPGDNGWRPHPASYPDGWRTVRARAAERGVKLGLWAAAMPVTLDELKASYTAGGFVQYKLDFANLQSRRALDDLMDKVRAFIRWTGHRIRINWDVTENPARYGYFFAREYGCIYLENRKPRLPRSVVYRPHTVLRDLWQVARYLNLHRFQCTIQNVDRVSRDRSDAHLHSHRYATAIALMGIPLFFQQTQFLSAPARAEIQALLTLYRQHRDAMSRGIVHPIGGKPDNASWTGFQCHIAEENSGYLTIFRERCNPDAAARLPLGWIAATDLQMTDLVRGTTARRRVADDGSLAFRIDLAPDFLFLHYTVSETMEGERPREPRE